MQALQDMEEGEGGIQAAGAQGQDQHQHNHHHHDHWEIKLFKYLNLNIVVFNQCCRRPNHHVWSVQSCWSLLPAFQSSFDDHSSPAWVRHWSYCAHPLSKSISFIFVIVFLLHQHYIWTHHYFMFRDRLCLESDGVRHCQPELKLGLPEPLGPPGEQCKVLLTLHGQDQPCCYKDQAFGLNYEVR